MATKVCVECKCSFTPSPPQASVCGIACRKARTAAIRKRCRQKHYKTVACKACSGLFIAGRWRVYCEKCSPKNDPNRVRKWIELNRERWLKTRRGYEERHVDRRRAKKREAKRLCRQESVCLSLLHMKGELNALAANKSE